MAGPRQNRRNKILGI